MEVRFARNAQCPCGSGKRGKACCGPVLATGVAPTPEALMRSRYTAYAVGDVGHVMRTTAAASPHRTPDAHAWREDLTEYCRRVRFEGLRVLESSEDGDAGSVAFIATLSVDGRDASFGERSRFVRQDGTWRYLDGVPMRA